MQYLQLVHPDKTADPRAAQAFQLLSSHQQQLLDALRQAAAENPTGSSSCVVAAPRPDHKPPPPPADLLLPLPARCGAYRLAECANVGGYRYLCIVHPAGVQLAFSKDSLGAFQQRRVAASGSGWCTTRPAGGSISATTCLQGQSLVADGEAR